MVSNLASFPATIAGTKHNRCTGTAKFPDLMDGRKYQDVKFKRDLVYWPTEHRIKATIPPMAKWWHGTVLAKKIKREIKAGVRFTVTKTMRQKLFEEIDQICEEHGIERHEFMGKERHRRFSMARADFCVRMHLRGWSYMKIGRLIGRDHTTVLHHVKKWEQSK